jgi:putative transposase
MEAAFCLVALEAALRQGQPEILNTDQGCQFTSRAFTGRLEEAQVAISEEVHHGH